MKLSIELDISKVAVTLYSVMCLLVETAIILHRLQALITT